MFTDSELAELKEACNNLNNMHYPSGPIYRSAQKCQALTCLKENEVAAIYHLSESHAPNLRSQAVLRFEKAYSRNTNNDLLPIKKDYVDFHCVNVKLEDKIKSMLKEVSEMPKEWMLVQLTSHYNVEESLKIDCNKHYTNPIHISVFNCGSNQVPFSITVDVPRSEVNGKVIEISQEMHSVVKDSKDFLKNITKNYSDKKKYNESKKLIDKRFEHVVKEIQRSWLREWRCLFIGKFINEEVDQKIAQHIRNIFREKFKNVRLSDKNEALLKALVKGISFLTNDEIKRGIEFCFQNESVHEQFPIEVLKALKGDFYITSKAFEKRHPVILLIDEKLDIFPWEMVDVLENHPVSRMPSFHFTYALFKEHEPTIKNGLKNINSKNGTYLINPDLDLKNMELRLKSFFEYWTPDWKGIVGVRPSESEFEELLTKAEIYVYNGHGNGTQFFSGDKIQRLKINAMVLLFGCASVKLTQEGPLVEMSGSHHMYLIACSPCVMGMLWDVTDIDVDLLSTEFLSLCIIPSKAKKYWSNLDKKTWLSSGKLKFDDNPVDKKHESEVLRAIWKAKKVAQQYKTRAACVARGLPVKIV